MVVPQDELQVKVNKLETLKEQWNGYYKKNRERILHKKTELREAKEKLLNESLGVVKVERRGRKRTGVLSNEKQIIRNVFFIEFYRIELF
jgi:hypothetical protein